MKIHVKSNPGCGYMHRLKMKKNCELLVLGAIGFSYIWVFLLHFDWLTLLKFGD